MNSLPNGRILRPRDTALRLLWMKPPIQPLPLLPGEKKTNIPNWRDFTCTIDEVDRLFPDAGNVGSLLGVKSHGLADADLDCREAIIAARFYLPKTGMMFGRASKRRSHFMYRITDPENAREIKFKDPSITPQRQAKKQKAMICELRYTGQTMMPGSINTSDGRPELVDYEPDGEGDPEGVKFATLKWGLEHVGATVALARVWTEGARHELALPVAGFLFYGGMPIDDAETYMRAVCATAEESEHDTENRVACVRDTYKNALAGTHVTGGPTLEDLIGTAVVVKLRAWLGLHKAAQDVRLYGPDGLPLAHDGDGIRFANKFGGKALYCALEQTWYITNGAYWAQDTNDLVREYGKTVADDFRTAVAEMLKTNPSGFGSNGVGTVKECTDWARSLGNASHITSMLSSAGSLRQIAIAPDDFDANDTLLNLRNGTLELDLQTGEVRLREHRPEDYITKLADAEYDPSQPDVTDARLEVYKAQFIPEPARWKFIEEGIGASMPGGAKRNFMGVIGDSNAGKSMLLRLLGATFGTYATTLDPASLKPDDHGGDRPRSDLLDLHRMRVVLMPEVGTGVVFATALFKAMFAGGDKQKARGVYQKRMREIMYTHVLWASGNKPFGASADDNAAYQRVCFIRFDHPMPEGQRDDRQEDATITSLVTRSALLAAGIRGFKRLYGEMRGRLDPPEDVRKQTAKVRGDLNHYTQIIDPHESDDSLLAFTGDPNDGVVAREVWEWARDAYADSLNVSSLKRVSQEQMLFRSAMEQCGAVLLGRTDARFGNKESWSGVRWRDDVLIKRRVTLPDWHKEASST